MYTLYNIIVSFHSGICVDFLGTHMISLVLFFRKPGVTQSHGFLSIAGLGIGPTSELGTMP
jgi:hypothetical protein